MKVVAPSVVLQSTIPSQLAFASGVSKQSQRVPALHEGVGRQLKLNGPSSLGTRALQYSVLVVQEMHSAQESVPPQTNVPAMRSATFPSATASRAPASGGAPVPPSNPASAPLSIPESITDGSESRPFELESASLDAESVWPSLPESLPPFSPESSRLVPSGSPPSARCALPGTAPPQLAVTTMTMAAQIDATVCNDGNFIRSTPSNPHDLGRSVFLYGRLLARVDISFPRLLTRPSKGEQEEQSEQARRARNPPGEGPSQPSR